MKHLKKCISLVVAAAVMFAGVYCVNADEPSDSGKVIYHRGTNVSGPESSAGKVGDILGTDYTYGEEKTYRYLADIGFDIVRIPVLWHRLQTLPGGELDRDNIEGLKQNIAWADKYGMKTIIDIHSFGRYRDPDNRHEHIINVIDPNSKWNVTTEDFIDLWVKLSDVFKDNKGIYAYDLMNEPFNMDGHDDDTEYSETTISAWHEISNATVKAIRANGDNTTIIVEGNHWGNAHNWEHWNGTDGPWIDDDNIIYSGHTYFDSNASGQYLKTFDEELAAYLEKDPQNGYENFLNIGASRVQEFGEWCKKWGVKGFLGEYSAPHRDDCAWGEGQYDTRWDIILERFLSALDYYNLDAAYWSAGIWWGPDEKLNIYPYDREMDIPTHDAVHIDVLQRHLSNGVPEELRAGDSVNVKAQNGQLSKTGDYVTFDKILTDLEGTANVKLNYNASADVSAKLYVNNKLADRITIPAGSSFSFDTLLRKNMNKIEIMLDGDSDIIFTSADITATRFEAENAEYISSGTMFRITGATASNCYAVGTLASDNDSIRFDNVTSGSAIMVAYATIGQKTATLTVKVNGKDVGQISLAEKATFAGAPAKIVANIPQGATVELVKTSGDTGEVCIDYFEIEKQEGAVR